MQSDEFAVVLLDVLMPGISGFETARLIRGNERSRHTPIIFLTASDIDRSQMEEGYRLGAVDFLVKPLLAGRPSSEGAWVRRTVPGEAAGEA